MKGNDTMSSMLNDFFGDSETAVKECLYCGGTDGELVVADSDFNGPTLWRHEACRQKYNSQPKKAGRSNSDNEMEDQ